MSRDMRGVSGLDLRPGDYTIVASEWRRDAKQQLSNLGSDHGEGGEPIWHIHDVKRTDGTTVIEVCEDRRAMEGRFQTSGRQFLFRTPEGEPLMAYEREGFMAGTTATLEDIDTGDVLASWKTTGLLGRFLRSSWELSGPGGTPRANATRTGGLLNPFGSTFDLRAADGTDVGQLSKKTGGPFNSMAVTLERSRIPTEILLAMSYGIFWALNLDAGGATHGSGGA